MSELLNLSEFIFRCRFFKCTNAVHSKCLPLQCDILGSFHDFQAVGDRRDRRVKELRLHLIGAKTFSEMKVCFGITRTKLESKLLTIPEEPVNPLESLHIFFWHLKSLYQTPLSVLPLQRFSDVVYPGNGQLCSGKVNEVFPPVIGCQEASQALQICLARRYA